MRDRGNRWAIVLAAGDGTRLSRITTDRRGVTTPKQYCSLRAGRSLLDDALDRAGRVVARHRIVTVVADQHRRWWRDALGALPPGNVVVQPRNRGTAPGVLLPLLSILARDPDARVLVLPSDHFVEDEAALARSVRRALAAAEPPSDRIVLIGATPDAAEADYGWIVPRGGSGGPLSEVVSFVEKPDRATAARLLRAGGAWNTFIFAAAGASLLALYQRRLPFLLAAFREANSAYSQAALYEGMLPADFSRDLLQGSERSLRLLRAAACGWTDLGTPDRVARCVAIAAAAGARGSAAAARAPLAGRLDLAGALLAAAPA